MMYRGIQPVIPAPEQLKLFAFIPLAALTAFSSWAALRRTPEYKKGETINTICVCLSALLCVILFLIYGTSAGLMKGILLTVIFLFASVSDIQTREVPDWVHIIIALLGLISVSGSNLLWNAIAGIAAFGFFFLAAVISKNKIGGADVKFIAACVFVLGAWKGVCGLILGLSLSVVGTLIRMKKQKSTDKTLPMIPYLSVGFLSTYMIGGFLT